MRRGRSSSWENLFGRLVDGAFIRNGQDLGTDRPNSPALSRMSELEIQNPSTKRIDNSRLDAMRGGENVLLGDEGGAAELS